MNVAIRVCVALALIEVAWKLGGVLGAVLSDGSPWGYLDDAVTLIGLVFFALLYLRERQARLSSITPTKQGDR
jgi:hypothetical protein